MFFIFEVLVELSLNNEVLKIVYKVKIIFLLICDVLGDYVDCLLDMWI